MDRKYAAFRLGTADLSLIRFAISPGNELAHAVRVLQAQGQYPLQWGWLRDVTPRLPREAFAVLATIVPPRGYFPDFLTATPTHDMTAEEELDHLRSTPLRQVRVDLTKVQVRASGARRRAVTELLAHPRAAMNRIADAWQAFWTVALEPHWPQLHRVLLADIAHRSRTMTLGGLGATIATLHERVTWERNEVRVRLLEYSATVDCEGSGLTLVPSVLATPFCSVITEKGAQPTLFYPAHGLTEAWPRDGRDAAAALTALLGDGRARVLLCLDGPRSTSETAALCGLAVSTASHHLAVLREAGLINSTRDGAAVMHARTVLGEALAMGR